MRASIVLAIAAVFVAGCTSYPSTVDARFGQAVISARAAQIIDPDAPSRQQVGASVDGQAAKSSVDRYQRSFDLPPPPVNVLNIGIGHDASSSGR